MTHLIKNIEGEEFQFNVCSLQGINLISGLVQEEDYINMFGFVAYLQNFTKVKESVLLNKPLNLGLNNRLNLPINDLEIDY